MIKTLLIGHLGADAVVREVGGKSVINFSVAHTEKYTDSSGLKKEKTIWVEVNYWTDRTAIAPYLKKGTQVYVEGPSEVRTWEKNGKHGASFALRCNSVQLLGSKEQQNNNTPSPVVNQPGYSETDDDLPF